MKLAKSCVLLKLIMYTTTGRAEVRTEIISILLLILAEVKPATPVALSDQGRPFPYVLREGC